MPWDTLPDLLRLRPAGPRSATSRLERCAAVARSFQGTQEALWSSMWPLGHCAVSSLLLCPLLRCADELGDWRVAIGLVAGPPFARPRPSACLDRSSCVDVRRPLRHAWCESAGGDVVDVTYGQFDGGEALEVIPAWRAGDLGHYASWVMTLDEEEAARRTISPTRASDGWSAGSSVRVFFDLVDQGA